MPDSQWQRMFLFAHIYFRFSVFSLSHAPVSACLTPFSPFQTCLRESDNSNEEDSLSTHSEDRLSEGSWDRVERKDTEVSV